MQAVRAVLFIFLNRKDSKMDTNLNGKCLIVPELAPEACRRYPPNARRFGPLAVDATTRPDWVFLFLAITQRPGKRTDNRVAKTIDKIALRYPKCQIAIIGWIPMDFWPSSQQALARHHAKVHIPPHLAARWELLSRMGKESRK